MKDKIVLKLKSKTLEKNVSHTIFLDLNRDEEPAYIMEQFAAFLFGCGIVKHEDEEEPIEIEDNNEPEEDWKRNLN